MKKFMAVILAVASTSAYAQIGTGGASGPPGPQGPAGPSGSASGTAVSLYGGSLATASSACAVYALACDLVIDQPITVGNSLTTAPNANIRFVQSGSITVASGQTLTIGSGLVTSAPREQVFFGPGSVAGIVSAMPDWFATPTGGSYPAAALRGAYNSTVQGAEIRLSATNYLSDFLYNGGYATSARWWHGAGRPAVDQIGTASGPQRFVDGSGSVIQGMFVITSSDTTISDLGIDYGAWVIANKYGGTVPFTQNGLQAVGNANNGVVAHNMNWRNVASLVVAQAAAHTMLIENYDGCSVDGAWVYQPVPGSSTTGGWGFIDKSQNCVYRNINVYGASKGAVYSKSDHSLSPNGHSSSNHYVSVHLNSATTVHDGGSFLIHGAGGDSNSGSQVDGLWINDAAAGIVDQADGGGTVSNWLIHGYHATNMYGAAVFLNSATGTRIEDSFVAMNSFDNNGALYFGASVTGTKLRGIQVSSATTYPYGVVGVESDLQLEGVVCTHTNYCLITTGSGSITARNVAASGANIGSAPYYSSGNVRVIDFTGNIPGQVTIGGSAIAAGACSGVVSVAVPGAAPYNTVQFVQAAAAGFYFQASVRTGLVDVILCNATPLSATPASATYDIKVIQ